MLFPRDEMLPMEENGKKSDLTEQEPIHPGESPPGYEGLSLCGRNRVFCYLFRGIQTSTVIGLIESESPNE